MATLTKNYQLLGSTNYTVVGSNVLRLYGKYNSQSTSTNKSSVTFQLRTIALSGSFYSEQNYSSLYCGGDRGTQYYNIGTVDTSGEKVIGTWTFNITHNSNGAYSGSVKASANVYGSLVPAVEVSFALPTIKRYPTISSATDFTDETNPSMTFTNYGVFPVRVKLEAGGNSQLITRDISQTATSYTFELTDEERTTLRKLAKNTNVLPVIMTVCAMSGNTELNSSYLSKKMNIVNANPIFGDFVYEDANQTTIALTNDSSKIINGYSNVKVTINGDNKASAIKEAEMSNYTINGEIANYIDDFNYTIEKFTNNQLQVYAVDSRGNSTLVTKILSDKLIDYKQLDNNNNDIVSVRQNSVDSLVNLKFNGNWWNDNFGNTDNQLSAVYRYKQTDGEWSETYPLDVTITDDKFSFDGLIAGPEEDNGFNINETYDIEVIVTDSLSTITYISKIQTGKPGIAFYKNKVGIGDRFDESDTEHNIQLYGNVALNGEDLKNISIYEYDLTNHEYVSALGWNNCCNPITTDILPIGKYLIVTSFNVAGTVAGSNIATLKVQVDGVDLPNAQRESIPIYNTNISTFNFVGYVEFTSSLKHTVNLRIYTSCKLTPTYENRIRFIKIG